MKNNLACHIVRDLLPTYIEGLTSDETARDVQTHLEECPECAALLREMREGEARERRERSKRDINYLKKVKRKTHHTVLAVILAAVILLSVPVIRFCVIGTPDADYGCDLFVEGQALSIDGTLFSSGLAVSSASASEEDGVVCLEVRSVLPVFRRSGSFHVDYTAQSEIRQIVTADGRVLWEEGVTVSRYASDIFAAKTPYLGDAPAVSALLETIGLRDRLGLDYRMELQTAREPFGLTLHSEEPVKSTSPEEAMEKYACLILACVDNLGYVTFDYVTPEGLKATLTYTLEDAARDTGKEIKAWPESEKGLQDLLNQLGLAAY